MNSIVLVVPNQLTIGKDNAAEILRKVKIVKDEIKKIEESVDAFARPRLMEKEEIPGLALKFSSPRRSISNVKAAYNAVKSVINPEDFTEICKIGVGDLEKLYKKTVGDISQAKATIELEQKLGDTLEMKQSEPTLILTEAP